MGRGGRPPRGHQGPRRLRATDPHDTRDDIRAFRRRTGDPHAGLLCLDPTELTSITSSSGTTGEPEFFPELWEAQPPLPLASARDLWELGLRPGDRVLTPAGSFRGFFDGELRGQPLRRHQARMVREGWGLELFVYTSAGDTGTAWERREHDGYHLWEDTFLAEHLSADGTDPVPGDEVGELVATNLDDLAAPLIRYRSDDLVRMSGDTCGCGRTHSRMWVAGRKVTRHRSAAGRS
jgi:phenylacetate-coenzyme A ligase PaaK-like adenylate-forming protein